MKAGQTSIRGGVQDLLCPVRKLYITQGANEGSHIGIEAVDITEGVVGYKAPYYAPADLKVVQIYSASATVVWQTVNKVRLANGRIDYVTIVTAHDETINFGVGFVIKQGQQMGNMGAKGIGTGVHLHIEQGYGLQSAFGLTGNKFYLGGVAYDQYGLKNQIPFEQAYFMDGTEIISGTAKWVYLKDVKVQEDKGGVFTFKDKLDSPVHIRVGEEGQRGKETGYYYKGGETLYYDRLYVDGGYTWVTYIGETSGERRSVAIAKGDTLWGDFKNKTNNGENLFEGKFKVGQQIEYSTRYKSHHEDQVLEQGRMKGYIIHIYPKDKYPLAISNTKGGKQIGATKPVNVYKIIS